MGYVRIRIRSNHGGFWKLLDIYSRVQPILYWNIQCWWWLSRMKHTREVGCRFDRKGEDRKSKRDGEEKEGSGS